MPLVDGIDLDEYAENTHGFVGADLESLAKESAMHARRIRPVPNSTSKATRSTPTC